MKKNKLKKYIILSLTVLIILLAIVVISRIYFTSKIYVVNLLNKGDKNVNYSVSYNDGELIDYVKGFEEKLVFSNGKTYYANYETGEAILIDTEKKTIELDKVSKQNGPHSSLYINDIERMDFEYKEDKKILSNDCIAIKLSDTENKNLKYLTKIIYINKKSGVIEKIEKYMSAAYQEDALISKELYQMHTGEVKDEDVKKPDLNSYSDYKIIDKK